MAMGWLRLPQPGVHSHWVGAVIKWSTAADMRAIDGRSGVGGANDRKASPLLLTVG